MKREIVILRTDNQGSREAQRTKSLDRNLRKEIEELKTELRDEKENNASLRRLVKVDPTYKETEFHHP